MFVNMSVVFKEWGSFSGSRRIFSALKDCNFQPILIHYIDSRKSSFCRSNRSYAISAVERASDKTEAPLSSNKQWENFLPFPIMIEQRRREAQRSLIVEVQNHSSCNDLLHFCRSIAPTKNAFLYNLSNKSYVLLEFKTEESKELVVKNAIHSTSAKIIPVTSPYLWFKQSKEAVPPKISGTVPNLTSHTVCDETNILNGLASFSTVADQMHFLQKSYQISDLSIRLRFFTCNQIERALSGIFPCARAYPFGSSVSGFGRNSADLDIYLQFHTSDKNQVQVSSDKRLVFHAKSWREDTHLQLKFIGDMLSVILPACSNVCSIMGARVPIIKYKNTITNMDCDVQNSSASGVDMTHLLWIMCHWDRRVAPLVYTLRYWAKVNKVTNDNKPSPFITNFNLMILIIFFLQVENILPTIDFLEKYANIKTSIQYDNTLHVNFLQDIRLLPQNLWDAKTIPGIDVLLSRFFEFYSSFNFESKSISIIDGKTNFKSDSRAMWIVNPLYPSLNTTTNVKREGVSIFQKKVRESMSLLKDASESDGLVCLIPDFRRVKVADVLTSAVSVPLGKTVRPNQKSIRSKKLGNESTNLSKQMKNLGKGNRRL